MPIGFNSPARNFFLLGSSGTQVITNFFRSIDQSAGTDGVYLPDEIKYDATDQKYVLAGSASDSNSKGFGWFEKRTVSGSADWDVRIEAGVGINTTLRAVELDINNNLIVVGKTGTIPWIAKYSNGGIIDWQSTTNSGDVEYTGVTSDSNGQYYACGNTPTSGEAQAFVEKFDASGNPGWGKSAFLLGRDVVLNRIAANSRGEVVAVGYLEDDISHKGYIIKIDANTGEVLWDRTLTSAHNSDGLNPYKDVVCTDVYIDINDQIYIVGNQNTSGFIIKYTAEGNIVWQRQTPNSFADFYFDQVKSDGETEQTVVFGRYHDGTGGEDGLLTKYSKNGDIVWRRIITSSHTSGLEFSSASLDADPSFYYLLFVDQPVDGLNGTPDSYTFGKVSTSGNGLGTFQYLSDASTTIDYQILNVQDEIGRLSDGSVRNDSSDLITYPFNANKLLFDDYATQITNKKIQIDTAGIFEYSGSPAIRPADFQELNLLGENVSDRIWTDTSGKGNDGVASLTEPFFGAGSVYFDGAGDYLDLPNGAGFGSSELYTIEFWVYNPEVVSGSAPFFTFGTGSAGQGFALDYTSTPSLRLDYYSNSISYNVNLQDNQWHHISASFDGTTRRLFLDGNLVANDTNTGSYTAQNVVIGRMPWASRDYKGYISNFRIIKGQALYTSNFTPPTTPLTAITGTELLTCQGDTIADASANNFTITANGNASPTDDGPTWNASGYWEFDGVDDEITIPYTPNLAFTDVIISCESWVYVDSLSSAFSIINKRGNRFTQNNNRPYVFEVNSDGRVRWILDNSTTICDTATGLIQTGQWYHLAATHDGTNAKIYINGVESVSVSSGTSSLNDTGDVPVRIGWRYTNNTINYSDGRIGEVRVYPRALTAAQVFQNYNATREKYTGVPASTDPGLTSTRTP